MHTIEVAWILANPEPICVGLAPRTVLQIEALRDSSLHSIYVRFEGLNEGDQAEILVLQQERATGRRRLYPEGDPDVIGRQDFAVGLCCTPCHAATLATLLHNVTQHPHDYWQWAGSITLPRGQCLGVIVQANTPPHLPPAGRRRWQVRCRVTIGGR